MDSHNKLRIFGASFHITLFLGLVHNDGTVNADSETGCRSMSKGILCVGYVDSIINNEGILRIWKAREGFIKCFYYLFFLHQFWLCSGSPLD